MLKKPRVTEKSMILAGANLYTFEVFKWATKHQIAKLVHDKFKVDVVSVKTINVPSKRKLARNRRSYIETAGMKKAMVQLKSGQKLPIFEQASQSEEEVKVTTAEGEQAGVIKEKKSLLKGTKVKVEKLDQEKELKAKEASDAKKTRQQAGKTKGEK